MTTSWTKQNPNSESWTNKLVPTLSIVAGTPLGLLMAITQAISYNIYPSSSFTQQTPNSESWTKQTPN